ncbi:MAG TPA: CARDB domain-containing protein [bacterium]|nr:CARDB domain-containing protein [bacterium]
MKRTLFIVAVLLFAVVLRAAAPVAAVMEIEDKSGKFEKQVLWDATDYFRTKLVSGGKFVVVDRTKQADKVKELAKKGKKESHGETVDTTYQIPLGKALAAQVLLRPRITSFAGKFTFAVEIISIEKEAVIGGASAEFAGDETGLAAAMEKVAAEIGGKAQGGDTAAPTDGGAQIRAALFTKLTLDGKELSRDLLEGVIVEPLQAGNYHLVDVGTALKAKASLFADEIAAGKMPKELTALEADALVSVKFDCATATDAIGATKIKAFSCNLSTKMIRIDNGEIAYAKQASIPGHGLSGEQAVRTLLQKKVPEAMVAQVAGSRGGWHKGGAWDLDIWITRIKERRKAENLSELLAGLTGVASSKLLVFNTEYAKFRLTGSGSSLAAVKKALFSDPRFPLTVVHETERTVHARHNAATLFARPVDVLFSVEGGHAPDDMVAGVVKGQLLNVEYLTARSVTRLAGTRDAALAKSAKGGERYLLLLTLKPNGTRWQATMELVDTAAKEKLLTVSGDGANLSAATAVAARRIEEAFKGSLDKPFASKFLKDAGEARSYAETEPVVIEDFTVDQILPALLPLYRTAGVGTLTLRNRGSAAAGEAKVEFSVNDAVTGTVALGSLAAGETKKVPVALNILPDTAQKRYAQMKAAVRYVAGEVHQRSDAYAPLLILEKDAIDWAEPRTLAAFIDPQAAAVRAAATTATAAKRPDGFVTDKLARTAQIFSSLWRAPLKYVADPVPPGTNTSIDSVQHPVETLARMAGDCDDLTTLLAALLESVGIPTAVLVVPGHVLLAAETGLLAGGHLLLGLPKDLFVTIDGALYVPIEATAVGASFGEAWEKGAKAAREAGKDLVAFRVRSAWKKYAAAGGATGKPTAPKIQAPDPAKLAATIPDLRKKSGGVPSFSVALYDRFSKGTALAADMKEVANYPLAAALMQWLTGKRDEAAKGLGHLCEQGSEEACYDIAALLFFEQKGQMADGAAVYEGMLAHLPSNIIDMMLDSGGFGLADEATDEAKLKRKLRETLEAARKKLEEKKKTKNLDMIIKHVAGRKGDDLTGKPELFLLLFWDDAR